MPVWHPLHSRWMLKLRARLICGAWPDADTATSYTVSRVTYVVKGDSERVRIVIPALTVMRFGRGDMKIEEFAVYFDASAVFERAKVVAERARWGKIVLQGIGAVETA